MAKLFGQISLIAVAMSLASAGAAQSAREAGNCYEKVGPILEKAGGRLTPEVRRAFLDWSENEALGELKAANRLPSPDCLTEVDQDPTLRAAIFGAAYPPDPSILQNYGTLQDQLGKEFTKTYRSLAIAVAFARRTNGVETEPSLQLGQENQASNWIDEVLRSPANGEERQLVGHLAAFMKAAKVSALELYKSQAARQKLINYLKANNESPGYIQFLTPSVQFGEWLKNALIVAGERPSARDPKPPPITWVKQVLATFESTPKSTPDGMHWPLFPINAAPWPLLMPLVHEVPLSETKYIWSAFQGAYGSDRFHTYGPYRDPLTAMPDSLLPSHWFWDAFPDRIVHGGECIPISKGTVDLYSSLGKPAMAAAQPGHSNLISFQEDHATWKAEIEQDFAGGPRVTFAQWFFDDPVRTDLNFRGLYGWSGAEYQIGLALGMNLGTDSYIDARIASNIFQAMPESDQSSTGRTLLLNALETNPFDPDPWYRLFEISDCGERFALAEAIRSRNPAGLVAGARCEALDTFLSGDGAGRVDYDLNAYWGTLEEFAVRNFVVTGDGPHDEPTMIKDFKFLEGSPGIGPQDLADFAEKFVGGSPPDRLASDTDIDANLAKSGDTYGRFRMGQRYQAGDGVPQDELKAKELFAEGAKLGDPISAVFLDRIHPIVSTDGMEITASSTYSPTQNVIHLIDGSGMVGGTHDNSSPAATMWTTVDHPALTAPAPGVPGAPAWVRIDFPHSQWFDGIEIWNENQPGLTNRGFHRLQVYGSSNGSTWYQLTTAAKLPQAAGTPNEFGTILDHSFSGRPLRSVIIAAEISDGNYGGTSYGLSAVRFVVHGLQSAVSRGQIAVSASSEYGPDQTARHLIDGSGMTGEFHDNSPPAATMWQTSDPAPMSTPQPGFLPSPAWVKFDFSHPRTFNRIMIWNHNQANLTSRGFRRTRIYGTLNGVDWFPLTSSDVVVLPRADGSIRGSAVSIANSQSKRLISSVIIAADYKDGNYGSSCYGLSAVRFVSDH